MGVRISAPLTACLLIAFAGTALAGSFRAELKSGVEVVGEITDFHDGYYAFQVGQQMQRIKVEDVARLSQVETKSPEAAGEGSGAFRAELKSGVEITGEITEFRDGYYKFRVGEAMQRVKLEDVARLTQVAAAKPVPAAQRGSGDVEPQFTLQRKSGQSVTGRIVGFDEGYYGVATAAGATVKVAVADVTDVALAWQETPAPKAPPAFAKLSGTVRIRASAEAADKLVPELLQFYAKASGQTGRWLPRNANGARIFSVGAASAAEQLRVEVRTDDPKAAITAVEAGSADLAIVVGDPSALAPPAPAAPVSTAIATKEGGAPAPLAAPVKKFETQELGPAGAVIIVNRDNPVDKLTYAQAAGIFSGKITDWSQLGGPHRRIRVHTVENASGLDAITGKTLLQGVKLMLSAYKVESLADLAEVVASDPTAIGITEAASAGAAKAVQIIDPCGVARDPDELSLKLRTYPLSQSFLAYSATAPNRLTREFRKFLGSDLTQKHLRSRGLPNALAVSAVIPSLRIDAAEAAVASRAVPVSAKKEEGSDPIERLSLSFGFAVGSTTPGEGSAEQIEKLKDFLEGRDLDARSRIAVVGFSDSLGKFEQNIAVSSSRARNIQSLLLKHGVKTDKMLALGPTLPIACETVPGAADFNRRVELWLY